MTVSQVGNSGLPDTNGKTWEEKVMLELESGMFSKGLSTKGVALCFCGKWWNLYQVASTRGLLSVEGWPLRGLWDIDLLLRYALLSSHAEK